MDWLGKPAAQIRTRPLKLFTSNLGLEVYIKGSTLHLLQWPHVNR